MELIRELKDINKNDIRIAGGKGASLGEITRIGIPIPSGFVILSSTFDNFIKKGLKEKFDVILNSVNPNRMHMVESASRKIQAMIRNTPIPQTIHTAIMQSFTNLHTPFVAVRSSATAEDSSSASWAGQLDSYLNTTEETLLENIKKCWASLFTPRAIFYRFEKNLHAQKISVSVVVQKMIQSETSGIAFSVHPVTEDKNQLIIESCFGLGEAIVSGQVTPNSYIVEKEPRRIINTTVKTQERGLYRLPQGGNKWTSIPEPQASSQVLSNQEILELTELILKIERHYGFPCDIEWAREGGSFYITQSRPITTLTQRPFIRRFQKFFSRELSIICMEYWHAGEYEKLPTLLKKGTHFNPLFIKTGNGLASVYYDMNNPKTALKPLFSYFKKHPKDFTRYKKEFEKQCQKITGLIANFEFEKYAALFNAISEAWGYLPIWIQYGSAHPEKNLPIEQVRQAYALRDAFQKIEYKAGDILVAIIAKKYPHLKNYTDVISAKEIISGIIPPIAKLRMRKSGFIYFERNILTKISVREFQKKYGIELSENLMTIGKTIITDPITDSDNQIRSENTPAIMELKGEIACPGIITGKVRIIIKRKEFGKFKEGEILVTPMTRPESLPLMKKAAAIITDEGGIMSHAAIVSRELKKPCVIGTRNATQLLKNGDMVEVDADNGIIKRIS